MVSTGREPGSIADDPMGQASGEDVRKERRNVTEAREEAGGKPHGELDWGRRPFAQEPAGLCGWTRGSSRRKIGGRLPTCFTCALRLRPSDCALKLSRVSAGATTGTTVAAAEVMMGGVVEATEGVRGSERLVVERRAGLWTG